jgi:hypothetical protein
MSDYWYTGIGEAVKAATDTICATLIKIKQYEYSSPYSNGALQAARDIVLNNQPHTDKAVVEAASEYLIYAFTSAKKLDLAKQPIPKLPDYTR